MVVADHGQIGGAQEAARIADELKRKGLLPAEFQVIAGERINCLGGSVTAVGLQHRVPEGMTFERTIHEVHMQGGALLLNHPGELGKMDLLRRLNVDGYFIQPPLFELFRTMTILYDPELADKPALYASYTRYAQGVGLPYSAIMAERLSPEAVIAALRRGDAYAASNLYFPLMAVVTLKPIAAFDTALNRYFVGHDWVARNTRRLLHADHVILTTTWDEAIERLISLDNTAKELRRLAHGDSPLLHSPKVTFIAAQYGPFQVQYGRHTDEVWLKGRLTF